MDFLPSDPEETKAVNMSKTQEALLTGNTSAGISGTESTRETASTSDDDENCNVVYNSILQSRAFPVLHLIKTAIRQNFGIFRIITAVIIRRY